MAVRVINNPACRDGFTNLTERWVLGQVVAAVRGLAIPHIRKTIPAVEGLKDEYEVEYAVGVCQGVHDRCIKDWEDQHERDQRDRP